MILEKEYEIKYYEMNILSALKESSLMLFMQDSATQSAESLGFGPSFVFENNYAWFLLKYHIEFNDYPVGLDNIKIKTEPRGGVKLFAYRDFEILTPDDETIARVNSIWALVDLKNKKMLPINATIPQFPTYQKRESELEFMKIPSISRVDKEYKTNVCFDDIDINMHANNANYIRWALEPLDKDFRLKNCIKTIDMVFKKEISFGGEILSQVEINKEENSTIHIVKNLNTDEELCTIFIKWEDNEHLMDKTKRA